jgi:hypothetical protein
MYTTSPVLVVHVYTGLPSFIVSSMVVYTPFNSLSLFVLFGSLDVIKLNPDKRSCSGNGETVVTVRSLFFTAPHVPHAAGQAAIRSLTSSSVKP